MFIPGSRLSPMLFLAVAACAGGSEPSAPHLPTVALNMGNGVELHVQGAGAVDLAALGAGQADFQFVARRKADGTANGHFRLLITTADGTADFEGRVTCVTTDPAFPGRARIGGVVTENNSTLPGFLTENTEVGDDVWFRVTDAGGGTDAADASTTYGFKPTLVNTSAEYCALPFSGLVPGTAFQAWNPGSIFPLARGTIGVKQ